MSLDRPFVVITSLAFVLLGGCDGLSSFERGNPYDPGGDEFAPQVSDTLNLTLVPGGVELEWKDKSKREEGFLIERKRGDAEYRRVRRVAANSTEEIVTIRSHGAYTFRVCTLYDGRRGDCATGTIDLSWYLPLPRPPSAALSGAGRYDTNRFVAKVGSASSMVLSLTGATIFDVEEWTWKVYEVPPPSTVLPDGASLYTAVGLEDGRVLALGHWDSNQSKCGRSDGGFGIVYSPDSNRWSDRRCFDLPGGYPNAGDITGVARISEERILVVIEAHSNRFDQTPVTNLFDPSTGRFERVDMPNQAFPSVLLSLPNGGALAIGRDAPPLTFEPANDRWRKSSVSRMKVRRSAPLPDGRLLLLYRRALTTYIPEQDVSRSSGEKTPRDPDFNTLLAAPSMGKNPILGFRADLEEGDSEFECVYRQFEPVVFDAERNALTTRERFASCWTADSDVYSPLLAPDKRTRLQENLMIVLSEFSREGVMAGLIRIP